ncbi:hypothetical protein CMK21_18045 [Candidatus Poribacteria bacterium]|nr:hypothetical protein [Candidatus Poribacteria bacterium]
MLTRGKTHYTTIRAAPVQGQLHMQTGKPLDLKDILHHVKTRQPKLVQQLGTKQIQHMAQLLLDQ